MAYQKLNWLNKGETGAIPINKTNLNHMDDGIVESNLFRNLFNKNDIVNGWLNYSNNVLMDITSTTFMTSGYIEVKPNTQYTINLVDATSLRSGGIMQYDSNFNWIQPGIPETQVVMTFTTTSTTKYVRFVLRNDAKDNIQFEENTETTEYTPFAGYIVESGSNDNSSWIKYSDGTLIQYGNVTKSINIKTKSNSSGWYYDDGYAINFPINFSDKNYFADVNAATGGLITLNIYSITNYQNSICEFNLSSNIEYNNPSYKFRWFAIGRWK